jgi:hypothetical protein
MPNTTHLETMNGYPYTQYSLVMTDSSKGVKASIAVLEYDRPMHFNFSTMARPVFLSNAINKTAGATMRVIGGYPGKIDVGYSSSGNVLYFWGTPMTNTSLAVGLSVLPWAETDEILKSINIKKV